MTDKTKLIETEITILKAIAGPPSCITSSPNREITPNPRYLHPIPY